MTLYNPRIEQNGSGTAGDNLDIGIPSGEFILEAVTIAIDGAEPAAASIAIGRNGSFQVIKSGQLDPTINGESGLYWTGAIRVRGGDSIRGNFRRVGTTVKEVLEAMLKPVKE